MSMIMIRVPRQKTEELKGMIADGLHIFGRAMSLAEEMCEGSEMGERTGGGYYGNKGMEYPHHTMPPVPPMPQYPMYDPYMGMRQGMPGTGRYY